MFADAEKFVESKLQDKAKTDRWRQTQTTMLLIPPEQSESGNSKIKEVCGRDAATRDAVRKKKGEKRVRNKKKKKSTRSVSER